MALDTSMRSNIDGFYGILTIADVRTYDLDGLQVKETLVDTPSV